MLQKSSVWKVASLFFKYPQKTFELREISRKIKLAHTSVKKHLLDLHNGGIIMIESKEFGERIHPVYRANVQSAVYKRSKRVHNYDQLHSSGLIEYLADECTPDTIVAFGSFVRGEDVMGSDIDIFVQCAQKDLDLAEFEQFLQRDIELHFSEDFSQYPKELQNNICNGIVLGGYLEVLK